VGPTFSTRISKSLSAPAPVAAALGRFSVRLHIPNILPMRPFSRARPADWNAPLGLLNRAGIFVVLILFSQWPNLKMRTFRGHVVNQTIRSPVELRRSPNPQTDGDGDRNHQNGYWHPILDVNAEDAESLDEDMQGRFSPVGTVCPVHQKRYYFYIAACRPAARLPPSGRASRSKPKKLPEHGSKLRPLSYPQSGVA
jgi:hypothetical protein